MRKTHRTQNGPSTKGKEMATFLRHNVFRFALAAAGLALSACLLFDSLSFADDFAPGGRYDGISEGMSRNPSYGRGYSYSTPDRWRDGHDEHGRGLSYDDPRRPENRPRPTHPQASRDDGFGTGVVGPDGRMTICRQGYANTVYCQ